MRGLWYFFGIVTAFGIFSGIAGLGVGYVAGLLWEQIHRHRRSERLKHKPTGDQDTGTLAPRAMSPIEPAFDEPPRLQLVSSAAEQLPNLAGRRVTSVRFTSSRMELDFGSLRLLIDGSPIITYGRQRFRYPEPGARDAICAVIGATVYALRTTAADKVEISFDNDCEIIIPRSSVAVA